MVKPELDSLLERATIELELLNLLEHDFGKAVLELLKQSHLLSNGDRNLARMLLNMPTRVYNGFPLSPITKEEFKQDVDGVYRCTRYDPAFLNSSDNEYYDSNGVGYIKPSQPYCITYGKNGNLNSVIKIDSFPYYPPFRLVEV